MLGHVLVHILGLDLEEQRVCICTEELTALSIQRLHLIVIEVIHQMLRELEDAQAGVYWSV